MYPGSDPSTSKNTYSFFFLVTLFSFATLQDLHKQIVSEIVFAGAKDLLVGYLHLWSSFSNPFNVVDQILIYFKNTLEIESIIFRFWKCKLFLNFKKNFFVGT